MDQLYQYIVWSWAVVALLGTIRLLYIAFRPGLRDLPGPWLAKFSPLWRVKFVWSGMAHEKYRELHKKHGAIVRTAPNVVDISDPAAVPIIYGINSKFIKSDFYHTMDALYEGAAMPSMFTTISPDEHKALKRPVAQKFSMTSIRTLEYLVDPCSEIFVEAIKKMQGQVVDLGVWVQWYAFDVVGAITFSKRFGFMEQETDVDDVIAGIEAALRYAGVIGQVPWLHPFLLGSRFLRDTMIRLGKKSVMDTVTNMVLEAVELYDLNKEDVERADFLAYLRQQSKSTGEVMGRKELMNHLTNNLLAGSDTTAISLRAVFYYVVRDKRIYKKLQKEIDEFHEAGKLSPTISYGESLQLEYLQLCMKEAMRMHPGVSYPLERIVPSQGAQLCGKFLPAGTIVGVNPAVMHRSREIFGDDADEFRPERWLGDSEKIKLMDRQLLTFGGGGARSCIGKNISIMEMGKVVPQILRQFDIEWASDKAEWDIKTFWFAKQSGLLVRFKERVREGRQA